MEWTELSTFAKPGKTIPPPKHTRSNALDHHPILVPTPVTQTFSAPAVEPTAYTQRNNGKDVQVRLHFTSQTPIWRCVDDNAENDQTVGDNSYHSGSTAYHDTGSFLSLSTIDGVADHASQLSHPCTITPRVPTPYTSYVAAPGPVYQPTARFLPLPERPVARSFMNRYFCCEMDDLERQHLLERKAQRAAAKRVSLYYSHLF